MKEVVGAFMNEEQFPKLYKEEPLQCEGVTSEDETGLALFSMEKKTGHHPKEMDSRLIFFFFFFLSS